MGFELDQVWREFRVSVRLGWCCRFTVDAAAYDKSDSHIISHASLSIFSITNVTPKLVRHKISPNSLQWSTTYLIIFSLFYCRFRLILLVNSLWICHQTSISTRTRKGWKLKSSEKKEELRIEMFRLHKTKPARSGERFDFKFYQFKALQVICLWQVSFFCVII